jgi:hypothetical protein
MLNLKNHTNRNLKLFKQGFYLLILVLGILFLVKWCKNSDEDSRFKIEDSPIKIELVKNIAQLASISYKDEVVVDSVEYYKNQSELITGNLNKLTDIDNFKYGIKASNVKRRLTLIVKGEILVGFNLKNKNFKISENDSSLILKIPKPIILDVLSAPSLTKVFHENGKWEDYEIRVLKNKAKFKMKISAEKLNLKEKAKENLKDLFKKLLSSKKKKLIFEFVN